MICCYSRYVNDILLKESDYLLAEEGETFTVTDGEIYNSNKVEFALDMKVCLLNCMCLYLHVCSDVYAFSHAYVFDLHLR